ncbi:unnamed protein product [Alternaria burnsii]|nr:unnamed protein product [Alternaria burnsii]
MRSYRYRSLQHDDSIRLLVLHPSLNGTDADPIRCTIQHAQLSDESLEYEAVSYTWGNAVQKQAIYFQHDTKELHVGQNCYNALRRLRRVHGDRLLWIDAICINQDNLQERASQVRIMDRVYDCASTVLVVLSETNTDRSALFEELAAADEELSLTGECKRDRPNESIIRLIEDLWRDPWFTRVWVLQEVYDKSSIMFICGPVSFSYNAFEDLYMGYSGNLVTKRFRPRVLLWIRGLREDFSRPEFNLWNRLFATRDCLATDPKDRIFALKSLCRHTQKDMDHLIEYTQSVEECYTQVAAFLLPVLGLGLLTAIRHPHHKKMASWIPDWSQNLPLDYGYFHEIAAGIVEDPEHTICSFPGESHDGCLELSAKGCRHAQIIEISQVFQFVDIDDAEIQMKRLYCSFVSLNRYVHSEGTRDDPIVLAHLGKSITHAMSCLDGEELHKHLARRYSFNMLSYLELYNVEMLSSFYQEPYLRVFFDLFQMGAGH